MLLFPLLVLVVVAYLYPLVIYGHLGEESFVCFCLNVSKAIFWYVDWAWSLPSSPHSYSCLVSICRFSPGPSVDLVRHIEGAQVQSLRANKMHSRLLPLSCSAPVLVLLICA